MNAADDRGKCARQRKFLRYPIAALIPLIILASIATSQEPPPDAESALRATRDRVLADLERMPRYTCVQTVNRRYYRLSDEKASCSTLMADHEKKKGRLRAFEWDRLRVEVAIVNNQPVYSWVGAPRFESGQMEKLAGSGPFNNGDFSPFLYLIFNQASVTFKIEERTGSQRLLTYSYESQQSRSAYRIKIGQDWVPVACNGTFTIDPDTHDIVSVTVRTAEEPESSPDCQAISEIQYGRTQIHDRMVLIPRETVLTALDRGGGESNSVTTYSRCREYASKTRLLFDGLPDSNVSRSSPLPGPTALPPGLHFKARIVTTIDSDSSAAGDPIEAVLRSPLRDKDKHVLAPAGARLFGRLLALEQRLLPLEYFRFSIQFESIELNGKSVPLDAVSEQSVTTRGTTVFRSQAYASLINRAPADKSAFFISAHHLHLEKFEWSWITVPYSGQENKQEKKEPGSDDH
jgi:hypothetical protein